MPIELIGIGGEPATGKTALMIALMNALTEQCGPPNALALETCKGLIWKSAKVIVLGVYDGSLFQGTDRLSMSVQPKALSLLQTLDKSCDTYNGFTVLFEGDRLYTQSFLLDCQAMLGDRAHFYLLTAGEDTKATRHQQRRDEQNERWLRSRATKYQNLFAACDFVEARQNETPADQASLLATLLESSGARAAAKVP